MAQRESCCDSDLVQRSWVLVGSGGFWWLCEPGEPELPQPVVELSADLAELLPHPTFPLPLLRSEEDLPALQRKRTQDKDLSFGFPSPTLLLLKILLRFVLPLCAGLRVQLCPFCCFSWAGPILCSGFGTASAAPCKLHFREPRGFMNPSCSKLSYFSSEQVTFSLFMSWIS